MREKRIGIENITAEDVYAAVDRWKNEPELKRKYPESKKYYLCVDGEAYSSKPILVLAYEIHYKKLIKTTNLEGGIGEKGVVTQLRDRLGFEVICKNEHEHSKYFVWEKINESIMIKKVGKLFLKDQGLIIPKKFINFFAVKCMNYGDKEDICFDYQGRIFSGWIEIDSMEYGRVFWDKNLGKHFNDLHKEAKKYLSIKFQRISENKYEINFLDDQIIEDEKVEPYKTVILQKEGKKKESYVTRYERNSANRRKAIEIHGMKCMICGFDFEEVYGEAGRNFIEVHHIKPLAELEEEVEINPETDLVCICSNCHSIIHRWRDKIYSIEEMKAMIGNRVVGIKDKNDD